MSHHEPGAPHGALVFFGLFTSFLLRTGQYYSDIIDVQMNV